MAKKRSLSQYLGAVASIVLFGFALIQLQSEGRRALTAGEAMASQLQAFQKANPELFSPEQRQTLGPLLERFSFNQVEKSHQRISLYGFLLIAAGTGWIGLNRPQKQTNKDRINELHHE